MPWTKRTAARNGSNACAPARADAADLDPSGPLAPLTNPARPPHLSGSQRALAARGLTQSRPCSSSSSSKILRLDPRSGWQQRQQFSFALHASIIGSRAAAAELLRYLPLSHAGVSQPAQSRGCSPELAQEGGKLGAVVVEDVVPYGDQFRVPSSVRGRARVLRCWV